jgi:uncharacterized repeat protein (TIGR01451 family)
MLTNEAGVVAVDPGSNTVMESATSPVHSISSSVDLKKTTNPAVVDLGSNKVSHTFTVENTGECDLGDVEVTHDLPGCTLSTPSGDDGDDVLQPDETWAYTCCVTAGSEDLENTTSVTATGEAGATVSDDSNTVFVDVVNPTSASTRTSAPPLCTTVTQSTSQSKSRTLATPSYPTWWLTTICWNARWQGPEGDDGDAFLGLTETWIYTCSVAADDEDIANTATLTATDEDENTVTDSTWAEPVDVIHPDIEIAKTADPVLLSSGSDVTFTITLTNAGDVTLTDIKVTDPLVEICNADFDSLDAGVSTSYTCQDLGVTESYSNTASVEGIDVLSHVVSDSAAVEVGNTQEPSEYRIYLSIVVNDRVAAPAESRRASRSRTPR